MSYAGRMSSGSNASGVSDTSVSSVSVFVKDVAMTFALLVSDWDISVNPGTRFVWGTVLQVEEGRKTVRILENSLVEAELRRTSPLRPVEEPDFHRVPQARPQVSLSSMSHRKKAHRMHAHASPSVQ